MPELTICWCCDRLIHISDTDPRPGPGDLTVCGWCGAMAVLEADLSTAQPNDEVIAAVAAGEGLRARYIALLRQSAATRRRDRGG